jgi:hypothetical protein
LNSICGRYWFLSDYCPENSNKFQKTSFWKEKSVGDVVKLEGLPFNSSMISFHIWLFKKSILHCKTMFICWVSLFSNGFTFGLTAQAILVYLWRKVVCLFCFDLWQQPNQDASDHILGLVDKLSRGGVHGLGSMAIGLAVQKFLNIWWFFHWKLN